MSKNWDECWNFGARIILVSAGMCFLGWLLFRWYVLHSLSFFMVGGIAFSSIFLPYLIGRFVFWVGEE